MNENEFQQMSAAFALGTLSPDEHRAFDRALAEHPEWAVHVRTDVETAARLADIAPPAAPPPAVRAALLARIADTPQTPDAPAVVPDSAASSSAASGSSASGPRRARRGWFVLAASLVLVAALGIGAAVVAQQVLRPAAVVALEEIQNSPGAQSAQFDDGGVSATAYWSTDSGKAVLVTDGLPQLPDDRTFELWFVRGDQALPAGTFDADDGTATALLSGEMQPGDVIAVTVEQAGGSPDGAPTSAPIVAIES